MKYGRKDRGHYRGKSPKEDLTRAKDLHYYYIKLTYYQQNTYSDLYTHHLFRSRRYPEQAGQPYTDRESRLRQDWVGGS